MTTPDLDEALVEMLTLTMEVADERGTIRYRNHLGQTHRVHGPAVIFSNGDQFWYQHGRLHRETGPAVVQTRSCGWYLNDQNLSEEEFNERIKSL